MFESEFDDREVCYTTGFKNLADQFEVEGGFTKIQEQLHYYYDRMLKREAYNREIKKLKQLWKENTLNYHFCMKVRG